MLYNSAAAHLYPLHNILTHSNIGVEIGIASYPGCVGGEKHGLGTRLKLVSCGQIVHKLHGIRVLAVYSS